MTRKVFQVLIDGEIVATKYTFNAARRTIPGAIRAISDIGDIWEMIDENQTLEYNLRTATVMNWERQSDKKNNSRRSEISVMRQIIVDVMSGQVGRIVERYSPNYNPIYANHRVLFSDGAYRIIMEKHMRGPMPGELRLFHSERINATT